jgi:hypothetical protein
VAATALERTCAERFWEAGVGSPILGLEVIRVDRVRPAPSGVARRPGRQCQRGRDGCEQEHADADTEAATGGQVESVV